MASASAGRSPTSSKCISGRRRRKRLLLRCGVLYQFREEFPKIVSIPQWS
jgi:hypothetical protein